MITTVTLNAAIDKTYALDALRTGRVQRVRRVTAVPGGKGINAARVICQLGGDVVAAGVVGGYNGQFIAASLTAQGIPHELMTIEGESRICLNVLDDDGRSTELLEPGPVFPMERFGELVSLIGRLAGRSRLVVFSGSLPAGLPADTYARLTEAARQAGAAVFLDASGAALAEGLRAKPDWIKPNAEEWEQLYGEGPLKDEEALVASLLRGAERFGVRIVVTLGADGALAAVCGELYRIRPPRIDAVNPVGSGDAFTAGLALASARGMRLVDGLRLATAAAAANALSPSAGHVRREDVERLLPLAAIERLA